MDTHFQQQQYYSMNAADPLLTPLVVRHRMSMPAAEVLSRQPMTMNMNQYQCGSASDINNLQSNNNNNNNGGVVMLNGNTVRWSCQSYESGITESSFNSFDENSSSASRVNVQEMLERGFEETEILRRWLDSFGLLCYFDCFLLAGYDSLSIMSRMTTEDLTAIGITDPNHRRRLKHELGKLHFADNYADSISDNLFEFLTQLGLEHYTGALSRTGCDTTAKLLQLELDDLEDVGVAKLGHQKKLYLAIKYYAKIRRNSNRMSSSSSISTRNSLIINQHNNTYDAASARPPVNHRISAHAAMLRQHSPNINNNNNNNGSSAVIMKSPAARPTSITKQLSTFQEAPRSPNVIVNPHSSTAAAANFVQCGGLTAASALTNNNERCSPYGYTTTTAAADKAQDIYSTGSISSYGRNAGGGGSTYRSHHSLTPEPQLQRFNYSPLRFPLKGNNNNNVTQNGIGDCNGGSSRPGSIHSGPSSSDQHHIVGSTPPSYHYQRQQSAAAADYQSSPTHSLSRFVTGASHHNPLPSSPSLQYNINNSTPPPTTTGAPPGMAQYIINNSNGHATLPRVGGGGRHSSLSSNSSGGKNNNKPLVRRSDTIDEPPHENSSTEFYCPQQIQQQALPPPPPPRARQTTLDPHHHDLEMFPAPPSPLAIPPPAQLSSLAAARNHQRFFLPADENNSSHTTITAPATVMLSRKQMPPSSLYTNTDAAGCSNTVRQYQQQQQSSYPSSSYSRTAPHEILNVSQNKMFSTSSASATAAAAKATCSTSTASTISSPAVVDCCMLPNVVGGSSMSTTDSGNSSASSVDEEHDARTVPHGLQRNVQTLQQNVDKKSLLPSDVQQQERQPEDVLNEISGMLANLTDELDYMLKS